MLKKDYRKLYLIQNKVLQVLKPVLTSFYLTGGTALGRYYLNHRFSEDLDFFLNKSDEFHSKVKEIEKVLIGELTVLMHESIVFEDFARYYIKNEETILKIEFVNDVEYRCGIPNEYEYGLIDTPLNILSNKLTAVVGRDEPKDVFDICTLAQHYSFNWSDVFSEAKNKAIINEIDVEQRIRNFPVLLLNEVDWQIFPFDFSLIGKLIATIADDFFLGSENSLGMNKPAIEKAVVSNKFD